ncbi:hypothetical protein NEOLEDRAFT_1146580 [Neolentinus lepideus HHB14362 ss-1]|uniref:F-box domain-containing protein n=1 Tax=Neolentinus lepideus HHB14362 ss-1 TaxID=1314782 RepID=A0A165TYZ3_9AGAM|nr:hypothetical protein NEOLEDRAFT_1146580 [Neolentinus lepideus HHB14362 ss-1]
MATSSSTLRKRPADNGIITEEKANSSHDKSVPASEQSSSAGVQMEETIQEQHNSETNNHRSTFLAIPLDVLGEIAYSLRPLDILHLSRTNKALKSMLMLRSSALVWRAALATAVAEGLPPCPSDLNEPQYIRLMFEWSCTILQFCGGATFYWGQWALRVRCCQTCARERLIERWSAWKMLPSNYINDYRPLSESLILTNFIVEERRERDSDYDDDDDDEVDDEGEQEQDEEEDTGEVLPSGTWYLKSAVVAVVEIMKDALTDEARFHDFLRDRLLHVALVNVLRRGRGSKSRRKEECHLRKLGYSSEIEHWYKEEEKHFYKHPLVKKTQSLTKQDWTDIKDILVEYMEGVRSRHLKDEWENEILPGRLATLREVLGEYYLAQKETNLVPAIVDFCYMAGVLEIVEAPWDVEVTKASFSDVIASLPEMVEGWRKNVRDKLFKLLPAGVVELDPSLLDVLTLATTQFSCAWDKVKAPLTSDRLFVHGCLTKWEEDGVSRESIRLLKGAYAESICSLLDAVPWGVQRYKELASYPEASQYARYIVEACDKDPETTTTLDMDKLDARLECTKCRHLPGLKWRQAVTHAALKNDHAQNDFRMHSPEETVSMREVEQDVAWPDWDGCRPWLCRKNPELGLSMRL